MFLIITKTLQLHFLENNLVVNYNVNVELFRDGEVGIFLASIQFNNPYI